jgi:hypothetical protein
MEEFIVSNGELTLQTSLDTIVRVTEDKRADKSRALKIDKGGVLAKDDPCWISIGVTNAHVEANIPAAMLTTNTKELTLEWIVAFGS